MSEVELELEELMTRPDGPFVARLSREPGRRESRYMQLFTGETPPLPTADGDTPQAATGASSSVGQRLAALEAEIVELRRELEALKARR